MRFRHSIPAGIADAAFASLASLAAGVYAARYLEASDLGVYSLFFSAFVMATLLPRQLVFLPSEVRALRSPGQQRLNIVAQSLRIGIGPALVASAIAAGAATLAATNSQATLVRPLALTMAGAAAISPLQAHVRRVLHLAGMSWRAAMVSIIQFGAVGGAIPLLVLAGVREQWIPFGSLVVANAVSLSLGLSLVKRGFRDAEIAERLSTSIPSVKEQLRAMSAKLGVSDRLELAFYACRHKI